jgi:hypothetical protein
MEVGADRGRSRVVIPDFTQSGVLPPFVGASPAAGMSPYATTIAEVAQRLVTNKRKSSVTKIDVDSISSTPALALRHSVEPIRFILELTD